MKSAIVHGALLAVMLVYGYITWTTEKPKKSNTGEVPMWNRTENDMKAVEFATTDHTLRLERRGQGANAYWWGIDTRTSKKMKEKAPPPPPVPGQPPPPPEEPEFIDETTTREFPVGEPGEKLVKDLAAMRAIKGIGVVKEDAKKDYDLVDTTKTIAIVFNDGAKTLVLGGRVQGGSDRYVLDVDTNKGFVLAGSLITPLEGGEGSLRPSDLRSFEPKTAMQVEIAAGGKKKVVYRIKAKQTAPENPEDPHAPKPKQDQFIETWGEGQTADTAAANFIDKIEKLKPTSYDAKLDPKTLANIVTLTYKDAGGKVLGTMQVLKSEKPGETPPAPPPPKPGEAAPPPPPPPGPVIEYYLLTERTRVPAMLPKVAAERIAPDIETVLPDATAKPAQSPGGAAPAKPAQSPGGDAPAKPAQSPGGASSPAPSSPTPSSPTPSSPTPPAPTQPAPTSPAPATPAPH